MLDLCFIFFFFAASYSLKVKAAFCVNQNIICFVLLSTLEITILPRAIYKAWFLRMTKQQALEAVVFVSVLYKGSIHF